MHSPTGDSRYWLLTVLFAANVLLSILSAHSYGQNPHQPLARQGMLDLRNSDLAQSCVELKGEWRWYWHQLRTPDQPETGFEYVSFPQLWSSSSWQHRAVPSQGYATYSLTVLLPARSEKLMLELPDQYSAYRLFGNGNELAHGGIPGTTSATTLPHWSTQLIPIPSDTDTLRLLLQIANFQHAKGGGAKAIRLGATKLLEVGLATDRALDIFLMGCLFMSGLFLIGLFGFSRADRAILFFGLFCLVYSYRIVGSDRYTLHALLPDLPWLLTLRLEYISLYVAVALFVIYTQALYPDDTPEVVPKLMAGACLAFAATVFLLPPVLFTTLMTPFLVLMVGYIGYAFYVYWLAVCRRRPGAVYSLLSTGLLLIVFCLIILKYLGVAVPAKIILFTGYLVFFFLQSLVLSYRYAFALHEARHTEKQFLANMSHEIRTPLNAVLGFSNLLEVTSLDKEQQEFVRYIRTASNNLLTIVNDILDIAKIEAGLLPLETIPFSIPALVESLRTMLQQSAEEKGLRLVAKTDPSLPQVLLGDPTRLTQILLNLLSNAIKFTQQGSVTLRVEKRTETPESVCVRFVVEDTGIGMGADVLPQVFERFRQANDSTTRQYGGTGLGLSIVKSLTELQGGWVTVISAPDQGSSFTVEITYRISPDTDLLAVDTFNTNWGPSGRSLTILVVEDTPMNQKLALGVLSRLGHTAQIADNGQQALDKLRQETFDLVLMDIQMPVMDGYTTTYHIRQTLKSQVPIIAMTAHALASEREQCLRAGMNDFLPKPFQPQELQQLIRKYAPSVLIDSRPVATVPIPEQARQPVPDTNFSIESLLAAVDGDEAFAIELLETFLEHTPPQLEQIRQASTGADLPTIGRLVHAQKAVIKMFGLAEISEHILTMETLIKAQAPPPDVLPLVDAYLHMLDRAVANITNFLRSVPNQTLPDEQATPKQT